MTLRKIEFNGIPGGEAEVRMKNHPAFTLLPSHRDFITSYIELLRAKKRIALDRLFVRYEKSKENKIWFEFLVVRGHINCNFIQHDNRYDIDENGNFRSEFILCPRAAECPDYGFVCNCPSDCVLTERLLEVLELIVSGFENDQIAEKLYLSPHTVHNHRNKILEVTGSKNTADMVRYWYENNLKNSNI